MIENGFVYAVNNSLAKKESRESKKATQKEKAYVTIKSLQEKYNFCFGYMSKEDSNRMTEKEKTAYYKAIKLTTTYNDNVLRSLGLCN